MIGGAAGYRPRVRTAYYERVYVHSPEGHSKYRVNAVPVQGGMASVPPLDIPEGTVKIDQERAQNIVDGGSAFC